MFFLKNATLLRRRCWRIWRCYNCCENHSSRLVVPQKLLCFRVILSLLWKMQQCIEYINIRKAFCFPLVSKKLYFGITKHFIHSFIYLRVKIFLDQFYQQRMLFVTKTQQPWFMNFSRIIIQFICLLAQRKRVMSSPRILLFIQFLKNQLCYLKAWSQSKITILKCNIQA